jgi:hypothetical protein
LRLSEEDFTSDARRTIWSPAGVVVCSLGGKMTKPMKNHAEFKRATAALNYVPVVNANFFKRRGRRHEPDVHVSYR